MLLDETFPSYPSISERDINLLIVEELKSSEEFQIKFFNHAGIMLLSHKDAAGVSAYTEVCLPGEHSAEIDVIAVADGSRTADSRTVRLLIENKIDVDFQPRQPERYRSQAKALVADGYTDIAKTLLMAPQAYVETHSSAAKLFDVTVSYEQIQAWLEAASGSNEELRRRAKIKKTLIGQGISKQKRIMPPIISQDVTLSWKEIYDVATKNFADLQMPAPGEKGRSSWSIDLPCITKKPPLNNARLEYVLKKGDHIPEPGTVTILLPGLAESIDEAKTYLAKIMDSGMSIRKAGKSLGITVSVDFVEPGKKFAPQIEKLDKGFRAARRLRVWFEQNRAELEKFAVAYGKLSL